MKINPTAKITKFTVVLEIGIDMLASIALTHLSQMDFFQYYQLDKSISVLRVVGCYFFHFYSNFNRAFCKHTVENLIRHSV